jgi:DNA-binding NarL/FixJ family response regulator
LQLHLSENTIKKYLHNVMEKLHLNNRVEAALFAVKQGLS